MTRHRSLEKLLMDKSVAVAQCRAKRFTSKGSACGLCIGGAVLTAISVSLLIATALQKLATSSFPQHVKCDQTSGPFDGSSFTLVATSGTSSTMSLRLIQAELFKRQSLRQLPSKNACCCIHVHVDIKGSTV